MSDEQKKGARNIAKNIRERRCWICGERVNDKDKTIITVTHETMGGKECEPKRVRVHFDCLFPESH